MLLIFYLDYFERIAYLFSGEFLSYDVDFWYAHRRPYAMSIFLEYVLPLSRFFGSVLSAVLNLSFFYRERGKANRRQERAIERLDSALPLFVQIGGLCH